MIKIGSSKGSANSGTGSKMKGGKNKVSVKMQRQKRLAVSKEKLSED